MIFSLVKLIPPVYHLDPKLLIYFQNVLHLSGLYPGSHNIIANQFIDEKANSNDNRGFFDKNNEESTGHTKWWHEQ